jgi:hypothetical protein
MNIVHTYMNIITSLFFSLSTTMITSNIHIIDSRDFLLSFFFLLCIRSSKAKKEKKQKENSFLSKLAFFAYVCAANRYHYNQIGRKLEDRKIDNYTITT